MRIFRKITVAIPVVAIGLLIITSCSEESKASLTGTVQESDELIVFEILPNELKSLDTLAVSEGEFTLNRKFEKPTFLLLEFSVGTRIPILIKPEENVHIDFQDSSRYGSFTSVGSTSIERMSRQRDLFVTSLEFIDSLEQLNYLYQDSANVMDHRMKWNIDLMAQVDIHREKLKAIIDEDTTDLANIMSFYQSLGQLEIFNYEQDFEYYRKVDNGLQAAFPNNEHALYFHQQLERFKQALAKQEVIKAAAANLVAGSLAPEIELNDVDGNPRKLSDLRGKVVLIDFWASWCGPCRRANPELVSLYTKYQKQGFDVFSVSLDGLAKQPNAQNDWRFAIESDGLIWPNHVSDLKGYESVVVEKYGFEAIPFTVLIDRDGKIIAKNIRGKALEELLQKSL